MLEVQEALRELRRGPKRARKRDLLEAHNRSSIISFAPPLQAGFGEEKSVRLRFDDYFTGFLLWKALAVFVFMAHHQLLVP
jgi:hypothetical protein